MAPKAQATKEKDINWAWSKFNTFVFQRIPIKEKATHRIGENICKSYMNKGHVFINIKNS